MGECIKVAILVAVVLFAVVFLYQSCNKGGATETGTGEIAAKEAVKIEESNTIMVLYLEGDNKILFNGVTVPISDLESFLNSSSPGAVRLKGLEVCTWAFYSSVKRTIEKAGYKTIS